MHGLAVRDVQFNGATLRAAQDAENNIWVGVAWVCQGLGLNNDRMKYERKKIQKDLVLTQGVKFYPLGTDDANSDVLCLQLDFLPLWLAKISITPTMKKDNPQLVENLVTYQLKAKDVLAAAFLNKEGLVPSTQQAYEQKIDRLEGKIDKMYKDMTALANIILDMKETSTKTITDKQITSNDINLSWKKKIYSKIDHICENTSDFAGRSDVLKWIYRYINKTYGIVWDQEIREYKERNNIHRMPSTIDVVLDKPIIKSIFESVLEDLEYRTCHKREESPAGDDMNWTSRTIAPLIAKYGDHSNAGMATYRRVYKKMDADNKICWKNLTTRYINEHGKKPSRKDLIETRPSLRKKFKNAVKELIEETQEV